MRQLLLDIGLLPEAIFANFIAGATNQPMVNYLQQATDAAILLQAPVGEGLTHLLQAVCHQHTHALYVPLRQYAHLRPEILQGIEQLPLLAIDDIDAVMGNLAWEQALFKAFNEAHSSGTQLILTTHCPLPQLSCVLPDWQSRLHSMLYLTLQPLSDTEKCEVLLSQSQQRGIPLSVEVARYLLQHAPRDMHTLLNLIDQLDVLSLRLQRPMTIPLARQLLYNPVIN